MILGPLDRVSPPVDTLRRIRHRHSRRACAGRGARATWSIPYETWRWAEPRWERGQRRTFAGGTTGHRAPDARSTYEDDRLVHQVVVDKHAFEPPQAEIIGIGTRIVVRTYGDAGGYYSVHGRDGYGGDRLLSGAGKHRRMGGRLYRRRD